MNKLEQIIKIKFGKSPYEKESKIVKEGFPIPSPESDESEDKYISRCISSISDEYETDQSYAICKSKWDEK